MIPRLRIELISLGETITREKFDSLKNLPVSAILWDFFFFKNRIDYCDPAKCRRVLETG